MVTPLTDGLTRHFSYLRLSVTDRCNFHCAYCLPNGSSKTSDESSLSVAEIRRLVTAFAAMGLWKVRITGGEPTLRRDILEIARTVASVAGVRKVALSTNGYRLAELAPALRECGVSAVNVSIDSLDPKVFREVTGHDQLPNVLAGIAQARALGMTVKVNAVLRRDLRPDEIDAFLDWATRDAVGVRFIELMPTADNRDYFDRQFVSSSDLQQLLVTRGWHRRDREVGAGPAVDFARAGAAGTVGIIAPYAPKFCETCNRLRVSSRGDLRLCLFGEGGHSLRSLLQSDDDSDRIAEAVRSLIGEKKDSHYLRDGQIGDMVNFARIGG